MRIYPLDTATKIGVQYHADIHLRPCLLSAMKFLSDAVFIVLGGKDKVPTKITEKGEVEYWVNGVKLLPPSGVPNPWALWTARGKINAWWMVDYAYQLNHEYCFRFQTNESEEEYLRIQHWVAHGDIIAKLFPAPSPAPAPLDSFPVVLPKDQVSILPAGMSAIDMYRRFYVMQKGKVRMRWTHRTCPSFFDDVPF